MPAERGRCETLEQAGILPGFPKVPALVREQFGKGELMEMSGRWRVQ